MKHSVRSHLGLDTESYDDTIRRFIPGYETMLAVAAAEVASVRPRLVVDLGAGTGALSAVLLAHATVGAVELVDVDPEMMARARRRLEGFGDRVRFTVRSFDDGLSPCDGFVASLSLHHIPTLEAKAALFARAFAALRPGGILVNADACMPAAEAKRERLFRLWADHLVASGIPEQRAWQHFEEWAAEDTYLPLDAELEALTGAGFDAAAVWTHGPMAVVVARKEPHGDG